MHNFSYARAANPDEAVAATAAGAAIIAGGTEFLNWMRLGITVADKVVDISRLDKLRDISIDGHTLKLGALATLNEVGESRQVREAAPVLAEACLKAASAQLRHRATIAGNILQKTRCPYFRAEAPGANTMPWPCNKRVSGSGCAAKESGYPRLALFGWTDACVATQPSDPAVALAALDAVVEVVGAGGPRSIPLTEFHLTQEEAAQLVPNRDAAAALENRLAPTDLIIGFRVPIDAAARRSAYLKVRERESYEYAMVSAAAAIDLDGGRIRATRIALGSVAQKPWRLTAAEGALKGQTLDAGVIDRALDAALAAARPLPGNEFKVALARNAARRALLMAGGTT
jgi:xanthine dehydrogenase YagS FAD-binding subunit